VGVAPSILSLTVMGSDQLVPPSVDCENITSICVPSQSSHVTYRCPEWLGLAVKCSRMPSRNVVFGRQHPGMMCAETTGTNGPHVVASSVERVTLIVASVPTLGLGKDANATWTSLSAPWRGWRARWPPPPPRALPVSTPPPGAASGRPGGPGSGPVHRSAVLAVAGGPRRLEPGDRPGGAGAGPFTTRPCARCRPAVATASDLRTAARLRAVRR
jgi:hypothetical protein